MGAKTGAASSTFGRSKRVKGSYDFKSRWGMVERDLPYEVHLVKGTKVPDYSLTNAVVPAAHGVLGSVFLVRARQSRGAALDPVCPVSLRAIQADSSMVRAPLLNTEEAAWFDSCSAYQLPMDILFLSHCVPNPPDKGEKIRAVHELNTLAKKHRVHLACFARSEADVAHANQLKDRCASVFVEQLSPWRALAGAALRFGAGGCLSTSYYRSPRMEQHIEALRSRSLAVTLAYSSAVVQFAPVNVPLWIDMVDVDSEKWLEYGKTRWLGAAYNLEGRRLRAVEAVCAARAECTFLTTPREQKILQQIAPHARVESLMNGVDFEAFDPAVCAAGPGLEHQGICRLRWIHGLLSQCGRLLLVRGRCFRASSEAGFDRTSNSSSWAAIPAALCAAWPPGRVL